MKTVWVYVDTNKKVGDVDHLKVFANADVADRWLTKNDPESVAFRYEVLKAVEPTLERTAPSKKKTIVANGELTAIFFRLARAYSECPYTGTPIAIVPVGRGSGWKVLTAPYLVNRYPLCAKRIKEAERGLQKIYGLAREEDK